MLLRASSEAIGQEAELEGTLGRGDGGVEHGDLMARFAEAATRGSEDLESLRSQLFDAVGAERFVEVAGTVGIFNGLVRVADGTGIPLDEGTLKASTDFRKRLGLDEFSGSGNSDLARVAGNAAASERNVSKLFA
jgi:hypothetical protein